MGNGQAAAGFSDDLMPGAAAVEGAAAAAGFAAAFFGAAFFAAGFAASLAAGFLAAGFFAAGFLAAGFFAAGFLAAGFFASARLPRTVMPVLQTLTNTIGESTNLAVLEDADAVYIGRVSAPKLLSTLIEPGTRLPAHTSAAGRLLLSSLPPDDLERWLARTPLGAFTPFTMTDKEALRRELTKVRKQGYCVTEGQFELGLRGVAVPLIDSTGAAVGAISASMAISSMTPAVSVRRCVPPLKAAAEQLRSRL